MKTNFDKLEDEVKQLELAKKKYQLNQWKKRTESGLKTKKKFKDFFTYTPPPPPPPKTREQLAQEEKDKKEVSKVIGVAILFVIGFIVIISVIGSIEQSNKKYTPKKSHTFARPKTTKKAPKVVITPKKKTVVKKEKPFLSAPAFNNYFKHKKAMSYSDRVSLNKAIVRLNKTGNKVVAVKFYKSGKIIAERENGKTTILKHNMRYKKWLRNVTKSKGSFRLYAS